MTRPERFAASTQQVSPLPIPLPLQNEVVDARRLLTVPWVSLFQWILNVGTRSFVTGTHAERVDPDDPKYDPANFRPGTWFWETDRTVLYQVRIVDDAPHWVYVLGTMYGTLTPDQQPDDLGPYDAGFQFAATDTGQTFLWDGAAWVDITSYPTTTYGTHAERLAQDVDDLVDGTLWVETDRGNALYQIQAGVWWYLAGTMFGTLVPDERPADLGVHDGGFDFRTSVPPQRQFMWSQTDWVETTATDNIALLANASSSLTLTTTPQAVPGTTLTLPRAGRYLVHGVFYFSYSSTDQPNTLVGSFSGNATGVAAMSLSATNVSIGATVTQQWLYTAAAGASVFLQAYKSGGAGNSSTVATHTSISAIWLGP